MKNVKKLLAVALALMLVMALATTAFAADVTNSTPGHTYDAYQVFKGTQAVDNPALAQIDWGTGVNGPALLAQLKADYNYFDACTTPTDIAKVLEGKPDRCDEANALAEVAYDNLTNVKTTIVPAETVELAAGYWLIVDTTDVDGDHDAKNLALLQVTNDGDLEINKKYDTPDAVKKVYDINDTTGETEGREDSADHDIGDTVTFEITATMGDDLDSYKTYKVVFHDTMDAGLTYQEVVSITLDDNDVTDDFTAVHNNGKLTITCDDIKVLGATNDSVIVVTYTAILNENAVVGATGNKNTMYMEFSNDPNWEYEYDPENPPETPPTPPTGFTPEDKVIVFTYTAVVDKVDEDGQPLTGAQFTLSKKIDGAWVVIDTVVVTENGTTFTWKGVDDGDYKLEETVTPPGYNTMEPIEFTITAEHDAESADPKLENLEADVTSGSEELAFEFSAESGIIHAEIENLPGTVLPETGGMGTTVFYIVGGLMVAAAVVLLVTKKRMAISE